MRLQDHLAWYGGASEFRSCCCPRLLHPSCLAAHRRVFGHAPHVGKALRVSQARAHRVTITLVHRRENLTFAARFPCAQGGLSFRRDVVGVSVSEAADLALTELHLRRVL